jgi:DNA-directed RNA polymerase alpha subunit
MPAVPITIHLPAALWHAVQALAAHEGDPTTVILRAVEEYITTSLKRRGRQRAGKYEKLVNALSAPVAALNLSARPAATLAALNIRYVYELVALEPRELRMRQNFWAKSLREVKEKLAALGLTLGMTLDDEAYRAAVVATVVANIQATKG